MTPETQLCTSAKSQVESAQKVPYPRVLSALSIKRQVWWNDFPVEILDNTPLKRPVLRGFGPTDYAAVLLPSDLFVTSFVINFMPSDLS